MTSSQRSDPSTMEMPGFDNPMMKPFLEFWARFAKESTGTAWQSMPTPATLFNPASFFRDWEKRWMDTLSDSFDAYLRSPQFLQWMRHYSDLIVKSKQQSDNVAHEFARNAGIPTAADISGLYERLHSFEDTLIRRLDKDLQQRMHSVDSSKGARAERELADRLDRFEETLKSRNGGEWRRHLDQGVEDLSGRLDRLETALMGTLGRIERRLGALEGAAAKASPRKPRPVESRASSASPATRSPVKTKRPPAKGKPPREKNGS